MGALDVGLNQDRQAEYPTVVFFHAFNHISQLLFGSQVVESWLLDKHEAEALKQLHSDSKFSILKVSDEGRVLFFGVTQEFFNAP